MGWEFRAFFQRSEGAEPLAPPAARREDPRCDVYLCTTGDVGLKVRGGSQHGLELKFREAKDASGWEKWRKHRLARDEVNATLRQLRQPAIPDLNAVMRLQVVKRRAQWSDHLASVEETDLEVSLAGPAAAESSVETWVSVCVEGKRAMCEPVVHKLLQQCATQACDGVLVLGYPDFCLATASRFRQGQQAPDRPPTMTASGGGGGGGGGSGGGVGDDASHQKPRVGATTTAPAAAAARGAAVAEGHPQNAASERIAFRTHGFSVVVCRHPHTFKWLAVNESRQRGWWLPAGHCDRGQTFAQAALRETEEEAGLQVDLVGVLAVEHSISGQSDHARMRVVFLATPRDPEAPPKSVPDHESQGAAWLSRAELAELSKRPPPGGLRGKELLNWAAYIEDGGPVLPLSALQEEQDGPCRERWGLCRLGDVSAAAATAADLLGV